MSRYVTRFYNVYNEQYSCVSDKMIQKANTINYRK